MSIKVPLAKVRFDQEEKRAVKRVLDSGWVSMGPETELFEAEFAQYLGIRDAVAVSSGTAALHLALLALGIGPEDEVILPSLTFVAASNVVLHVGARPVFADVSSLDDWNISPYEIERRITSKTKAIMVMHYGGFPCRMDLIKAIADQHQLKLIEDAAHAPGASFQDKKIGTWGDAGCFSFFANKNITTAEGGMIVTNDALISARLKRLRSHGMTATSWDKHRGHSFSYDVLEHGHNYRIDEIRAALGRVQLRKLDDINEKRRNRFALLRDLLRQESRVSFPFSDEMLPLSSCHIFPVLVDRSESRSTLMESMTKAGIQTSIHYPPVHLFTAYRNSLGTHRNSLALTEEIGRREVTLPMYADIMIEHTEMIASELIKCCQNLESTQVNHSVEHAYSAVEEPALHVT